MNEEIGYVIESRDFLVYLDGLPTIQIDDMVESENGLRGWVNTLAEDKVEVLMLDEGAVTIGQSFKRLPQSLSVSAGDFLLGRAINPLGIPVDGKGIFTKTKNVQSLDLEQPARGIQSRKFITDQFLTGVTLIDMLIPIGKGQRQLVIGDAHSGKTSFLIDLIVNQKGQNTICIYASIGKHISAVKDLLDVLRSNKALAYTILVASTAMDPAPLIFLTPKTAFSLAEYFQKKGLDVLVILDDLGIHAKIYREMSLLGGKSPGRESYPGDIFYQHAHIIERAGNFRQEFGGGSITAIPIIELNLTDFTTFIPTNLMAMTDGHWLFKSTLHNIGQRPAIDISLSVSRVGRQTQDLLSNLISQRIRQILSQAEELQTISHFSSELPPQTQLILLQKSLIQQALTQEFLIFSPKEIQIIMLGLILTSFLPAKGLEFFQKNKKNIANAFTTDPQLIQIVKAIPNIQDEQQLIKMLEDNTQILESLLGK